MLPRKKKKEKNVVHVLTIAKNVQIVLIVINVTSLSLKLMKEHYVMKLAVIVLLKIETYGNVLIVKQDLVLRNIY